MRYVLAVCVYVCVSCVCMSVYVCVCVMCMCVYVCVCHVCVCVYSMLDLCCILQHGRQREFLVRERVGKDGYFAISIRHHYR